jgi:uncharacterized protein
MNVNGSEQTILWRGVDAPGHDACALVQSSDGWSLSGAAVFAADGQPCRLCYEVKCDATWKTRSARVEGWSGKAALKIALAAVSGGGWSLNGIEQAPLAGLVDVDLGFTPATNLIQLRRLALGVGCEADAPAAYLNFPELKFTRLEQSYRRVSPDRYYYQAPAFGYAGILQVSDVGFVTHYPGLWVVEALR